MWAAAVLADSVADAELEFGGVSLIPASNPVAAGDLMSRLDVGWLVIAAHPALARAADLTAALAAGRHPDRYVTRLITPHAPIATVCALAQARSVFAHPGRGLALAEALLAASWSAAWVQSVSRLQHPAPGLAQHLRSFLPGAGFVVRHLPEPAVLPATQEAVTRYTQVDPAAPGGDRVLVAEENVPSSLGTALLAGPARSTRTLRLGGSFPSVYGTPRAAQLALLPADVQSLVAEPVHRCPSCGLELPPPVCPFCRVAALPQRVTSPIPTVVG